MGRVKASINLVIKYAKGADKIEAELAFKETEKGYNEFRRIGTELEARIKDLQVSLSKMHESSYHGKVSDQDAQAHSAELKSHCAAALNALHLLKKTANMF